jgi:hypothetical protein
MKYMFFAIEKGTGWNALSADSIPSKVRITLVSDNSVLAIHVVLREECTLPSEYHHPTSGDEWGMDYDSAPEIAASKSAAQPGNRPPRSQ